MPQNLMQKPNHVGKSKFGLQNPRSQIRNANSKLQDPRFEIRNPNSKLQTPKSKLQNQRSKIKTQTPKSKTQNSRSQIQTPKSKRPQIQNPNGPFGLWILDLGRPAWGRRPCSKPTHRAVPAKFFGFGGKLQSSQPKGASDFQRRISPVSWKSGLNFQRKGWRRWYFKTPALGVQLFECGHQKKEK